MKGRSAIFRGVVVAILGLVALAAFAMTPLAAAQDGCLKGNVMLALRVNGTVELCPSAAAKAPDLQKRLDELQKTNQELLRELARSARSVNALGRDVDSQRQGELLHSFDRELENLMKSNQKEVLQQTAKLADKLDNLQDMVAQSREDQQTAVQTMTALNGQLGDAIAALDIKRAEQQLQAIQAKLNKIEENTERTNKILEEQAVRQKAADDKEKALDNDPNIYTRAQISPNFFANRKVQRYAIYMYSRPPNYPPFIDSTLTLVFHKGDQAWRFDGVDKQVNPAFEAWRVNVDEISDRATLCFVAHDKESGRLREWIQRYRLTASASGYEGTNFLPEGEATMRLTDGGTCDGVITVRQVSAPPSELARQQEKAEAIRQRASQPKPFATITASGSRRDQNSNQWVIQMQTQPMHSGTTLYDEHMEAYLIDASNRTTPLQLGGRQISDTIELRYASVDHMGTKAVVCLTARDPASDNMVRLTQWFDIETSNAYFHNGSGKDPDDMATFIPAKPATLTDASNAPCQ
jgi:hypothetical protein